MLVAHLSPFRAADGAMGVGFAARPDTKDEVVKAQYEKALDETSAWFKEHL